MRSLRFVLSICLPLAVGGCVAADDGTDDVQTERAPLGKADAAGSCVSDAGELFCDGQSDGPCWCDELCVGYGDCCSDVDEVCGDDSGGPDGCLSSAECGASEFCSFASGCGEGPEGSCEPRPQVCPQNFAPVCGCDGETYSNACMAAGAGVSVQSPGPCEVEPPPPPPPATCEGSCGGNAGPCWCDEACTGYGDCCSDYEEQCGEPPPPPPPPPPANCEELLEAFAAQTDEIRSCEDASECGQVLTGTSCGCTRNWVARNDADTGQWESLRELAGDMGCSLPGTISTCDCPAVDGFACYEGTCTWNYL